MGNHRRSKLRKWIFSVDMITSSYSHLIKFKMLTDFLRLDFNTNITEAGADMHLHESCSFFPNNLGFFEKLYQLLWALTKFEKQNEIPLNQMKIVRMHLEWCKSGKPIKNHEVSSLKKISMFLVIKKKMKEINLTIQLQIKRSIIHIRCWLEWMIAI